MFLDFLWISFVLIAPERLSDLSSQKLTIAFTLCISAYESWTDVCVG